MIAGFVALEANVTASATEFLYGKRGKPPTTRGGPGVRLADAFCHAVKLQILS